MREEKILDQLKVEPDIEKLDAFGQRRLQELTDERSVDILNAFLVLARDVAGEGKNDWQAIVQRKVVHADTIFGFVARCGGSMPVVQALRGHVKQLKQIRDDDDNVQTIHHVLHLLTRGSLLIRLPEDGSHPECSAVVPAPQRRHEGNGGLKALEVTEATLQEWRAQLDAVGTEADEDDLSDDDDDAQAQALRLRTPQDRRKLVQLFTRTIDLIWELKDVSRAFQASGHPRALTRFTPQLEVSFEGSHAADVLKAIRTDVIGVLKAERDEWAVVTLPNARRVHPVLAHVPRAVLARCVAAADERDAETLRETVAHLTGAALDVDGVARALDDAFEGDASPASDEEGDESPAGAFLAACAAVAAVVEEAMQGVKHVEVQASVDAVDSLCRPVALVSVADTAEVTAAHVPILATAASGQLAGRMPHPHEILLCEEGTPLEDVDDMLYRWSQSRREGGCCFTIANVERLERGTASHLAAQLRRIAAAAATAVTPLLVWVSGPCPQVRDLKPFQTELGASVCRALLEVARPVFAPLFGRTFASPTPHAGKTRRVMRDAHGSGELYASAPVSGQTTVFAFVELLAVTVREAQAAGLATCLHIDLSPDVDVVFATTALFGLVVFRRMVGRSGMTVHLPDTMRVAVEVASDPFRNVVPLVELFAQNVEGLLSTDRVVVEPYADATRLYALSFVPDTVLEDGARLLLAYAKALETGDRALRSATAILHDPVPAAEELTRSARFLLDGRQDAPLPTNVFAFFRFAAVQGSHIVGSSNTRDASVFLHLDDRNTNRLLFYYLKLAVQCAKWMAAEGLRPKKRVDEDDAERFADMESFESWSREPLLVAEPDDYTVLSLLDENCHVLQHLTRDDGDKEFRQFMKAQTMLNGASRSSLQGSCSQVSNSEIFRNSEANPLCDILRLISPNGKLVTRLFAKLKRVDDLSARAAAKEGEVAYFPDAEAEVRVLEEDCADAACDGYGVLAELGVVVPGPDDPQRRNHTDFKTHAERWLKSIFGTRGAKDKPPFVLLVDLLIKIVSMKLRVVCGLPVLWVGESGSGKTIAVEVFARVSTGHAPYVINVNGGVTPQRLLELLRPAIDGARAHPGRKVVVQLDEVNTMADMWTAKQAVCDRFVLGERIPDNVLFVAIMNPVRRRTAEQQAAHDAIDALGGMNYNATVARATSSAHADEGEPVPARATSYVYHVNATPDSMMAYAWDFGSAAQRESTRAEAMQVVGNRTPLHFVEGSESVSDEVLFAEETLDWVVRVKLSGDAALCELFQKANDRGGRREHWRAFRSIVCALLSASQRFLRETVFRGDRSVVSLRDMVRAVKFIPFVLSMFATRAAVRGVRGNDAFADLTRSVQVAFTLVYHLRLDASSRSRYLEHLRAAWENERRHFKDISEEFMAVPAGSSEMMYSAFDELAEYCCGCLPVDDGLAVNEALKENVLSMFVAFMTQQAHFIVGRAGSSKTRSVESLIQATDPGVTSERCRFFLEFGVRFQKFVLQCSRSTSPEDVLRVAQAAAKYQASREEVRCVLVLEEVGVTIGSKHNPLMMLHSLIDFGVPVSGAAGTKHVRLAILGVSNWMLDGSKMNRGTTVHRGNPSVLDLVCTAENLSTDELPELGRFADVFHGHVLSTGTSERLRTYRWFYGMRDFYSFVKTLGELRRLRPPQRAGCAVNTAAFEGDWEGGEEAQFAAGASGANRRAARDGQRVHRHLVAWALRIAFGGLPSQCEEMEHTLFKRLLASFDGDVPESRAHFECSRDTTPAAIASAIEARGHGAGRTDVCAQHRQPTCSVCALLRFETALRCSERLHEAPDGDTAAAAGARTAARTRERCDMFGRFATAYEKDVNCGTFDTLQDAALPLDAEVMAYALSNPQARHLLLFTRDNSALRLLFDMGFVSPQRSTVIFGASPGCTLSQTTRSADLAKVKACLRRGDVLVLVNANHLYETILDPLNLNYTKEGTTFRTHLPTATGYSQSVRTDPRFRCVVLCEEAHATSLLPPFVNRFMKARLSFARMLTVPQRNKCRDIEERTNLVVVAASTAEAAETAAAAAAAARVTETVNLLSLVVPGFSSETLPSAVMLADVSLHERAAAAAAEDVVGAGDDDEEKFAVESRLAWCASPWALERAYNGLACIPGLNTDRNRAVVELMQNRMLNFDGTPRAHVLAEDAYDAWALNPSAQHFFVSTEQVLVDFAVVAGEVKRMLAHTNGWDEQPIECEVIRPSPDQWALDLGAEGSDATVRSVLRELGEARCEEGSKCAVAVLYFDATVALSAVDGIMFDISQRRLEAGRHVFVVALARTRLDAAGREASYKLTLVPDWVQLHVDEVVPSLPQLAFPLPSDPARHVAVPLHRLRSRRVADGDADVFARWGARLLRKSRERVAQDFASVRDSIAAGGHALRVADVEALQKLPHFDTMCGAAAQLLLRDVDALRDGRWVRLALQCAGEAGSLRQSLCLYLAGVWSRCLACLFAPVITPAFVREATGASEDDDHHAVFALAVLPGLLGARAADALGEAVVKIPDAVLAVSTPLRGVASLPLLTSVWREPLQPQHDAAFPLLDWVASLVSREASRLREGEVLSTDTLEPRLLQAVSRQPQLYLHSVLRRLVGVYTTLAADVPGLDDITRAVLNLAVATSRRVCPEAAASVRGEGDAQADVRTCLFVHTYLARWPDMVASVCVAVEHVAVVGGGGAADRIRRFAAASQAEASEWTQRHVADALLSDAVTVGVMPSLRRVIEACAQHGVPAEDVGPAFGAADEGFEADGEDAADAGCVFLWPVEEAVAAVADGDKPFAAAVAAEGRRGLVEALRVVLDAQRDASDEARLILVSELLSPSNRRDTPCAPVLRDLFAAALAGLRERPCSELWRATLTRYFAVYWLAAESVAGPDADTPTWDPQGVLDGCGGPVEFVHAVVSLVADNAGVRGVPPLEALASEASMDRLRAMSSAGHAQAGIAKPVMFGVLAAAVSRLACSLRHHRSSGGGPAGVPHVDLPLLRRCVDAALRACQESPLHEMLLAAFIRGLSVGGVDSDRARQILQAEQKLLDASSLLPAALPGADITKRFLRPPVLTGPLDSLPQYAAAHTCFERSLDSDVLEDEWDGISAAARAAVLALRPAHRRGENVWQRAAATLAPDDHFGRWVRGTAQASDPVGFDQAEVEVVKEFVVHAQMRMLVAGDAGGVLGFFGGIARNTYDPTSTFPCVPDSLEADSILNAPGGTYVYRCPNGHHYTTDACPAILQQQGACQFADPVTGQRCGAAIGGSAYGVPLPGNRHLGTVGDFANRRVVFHKTTGYANSAPMSDAHLPRDMPAAAFYACRVLTIVALLCSSVVAPTEHHRADYWVDLRGALTDLRNRLFPGAEVAATIRWLHAMLAVSLAPGADEAHVADRSALEQVFVRHVGPQEEWAGLLRRYGVLRARGVADGDAVRDQIALADAYVAGMTAAGTAEEWQLRAFEYRGREDLPPSARADAALDDAAARSPLVAAVRRCLPCVSERRVEAFFAFTRFVGSLTAAAERQALTPQQTQTMSVADVIASAPDDDDTAELGRSWAALREVGPDHLVRHVKQYNCTNVAERFADVVGLPETCSVALFLPAAEDEGLFAKALYGGLGADNAPATVAHAQNELVRETHRYLGLEAPRAPLGVPAETARHDVLCVAGSVAETLRRVIAPFTSDLGCGRVSDELLPAVEKRVIVAARLALAPLLPAELPDYRGGRHPLVEFCAALEAAGQCVTLPPPAVAASFLAVADVRPLRAATYSLLLLLAMEWMRRMRRDAADWTATTALDAVGVERAMLTPLQSQALDRLAAQRHVFSGCTLAMLPVVLGLLWIPDDLPDSVREAPDAALRDAIDEAVDAIKASPRAAHAVTLLRLLGIVHLHAGSNLTDALLDCDVFTHCDGTYAHPLEDEADGAVIDALSNVPLRHYAALREAVEQALDGGHAVFVTPGGASVAGYAAAGGAGAPAGDAAALRRSLVTNAPVRCGDGAPAPARRAPHRAAAAAAAREAAEKPASDEGARPRVARAPEQRAPRIRWGDGRRHRAADA